MKEAVTSWLQTLHTGLFFTLVLLWDKCLNANSHYLVVLSVPPATHFSCNPIHLRIGLSTVQILLTRFKNPPCASVQFNTNSTPQNPLSNYKAVPQWQQHNFCNCYIRSVHTVSYRKFCCRCQEIAECVGAEWQVWGRHRADWWTNQERTDQPCLSLAEQSSAVCHRRCVQWVLQHQATNWYAGRGGNYHALRILP